MTDNFPVDGPVVNEGELGSHVFPGPAGPLGLGQRWTVTRKREVALRPWRAGGTFVAAVGRGDFPARAVADRRDRWLKERKGDPVKAELDIARIHAGTAGGHTSGPLGRLAAMSAANGFGLSSGSAAWGFARSSTPGSRPPLSAHQQSAGDRSPHLGRGSNGGHRGRPGGIPLGGRGTPQGLGSASTLSWHPRNGCARTTCSRPIAAAAVAEIPMSIITRPQPSCGALTAFHGGRRLGLDRHRALERTGISSKPISIQAVCLDLRRCGAGAGLADDHGSQYLSSPTRSSSGASSRPTPSSNSPRPTASREVQSHAHGTPSAGSSNSTMPSGSWRRTAT